MNLTEKDRARFESKVYPEPNSGCWLWGASVTAFGYGQFGMFGKSHLAHRISFEMYIGTIPDGMCVLHKCDVPACVNPNHFFIGTRKDNIDDAVAKGRQPRAIGDRNGSRVKPESRPRGDRHWNAKLTDEEVAEIRSQFATGRFTKMALSRDWSTPWTTICGLVTGKSRAA